MIPWLQLYVKIRDKRTKSRFFREPGDHVMPKFYKVPYFKGSKANENASIVQVDIEAYVCLIKQR